MYLYWWGKLNPDDRNGLFSKFWSKAPGSLREYALNYIGFNLYHSDDPIAPDVLDRLKNLWEARIDFIKKGHVEPDELSEFGWWFASGQFDENWSMKQLIDALSLVGETKLDFRVLDKLSASASQNPKDTIKCLELIIKGKQNKWQIHTWRDKIRSILGTILECEDASVAKAADDLINYLSSLGYLEYKDLPKQSL
jgi:FtsZ-binding cell division protein ZapB